MEGRQLRNYVISRRIAEKRRAPLATPARNALQKGERKLRAACEQGDTCYVNAAGTPINRGDALEALQRRESVTLKRWRCVREPADFFDDGEYALTGECTVKL